MEDDRINYYCANSFSVSRISHTAGRVIDRQTQEAVVEVEQ